MNENITKLKQAAGIDDNPDLRSHDNFVGLYHKLLVDKHMLDLVVNANIFFRFVHL